MLDAKRVVEILKKYQDIDWMMIFFLAIGGGTMVVSGFVLPYVEMGTPYKLLYYCSYVAILTSIFIYYFQRKGQKKLEKEVCTLLSSENYQPSDFEILHEFYEQSEKTLCVSDKERVEWALTKLQKTKELSK